MPVRTLCELDDPLLRRSFQAGGQPARAQVGGRSGCPWVTAGDRSFPPVLARTWHAAGEADRQGPLSPWPVCLVVADSWIVRAQLADEFTLDAEYFRVCGVLGLPEDLFTDREVSQLFSGEVLTDQLVVGASEVVGTVCQVAADVDLPVRVCNLVNDLEPPIIHSRMLGFLVPCVGLPPLRP